MRKKNKILLFLATVCAVSCFGACNSSGKAEEIGKTPNYEWAYAPTMGDPCDEDMKIDGVLDEARWQGQQKLEHTEKGVKMSYTTIFTDKGLYIGAVAEDEEIEYKDRLRYEEQSCFWFSIKGADIDVTKMKGTEVFNFYVDGKTASSFNHARYQAKGQTDKPYDQDPTRLTVELFVTWDAINVELGENGELPDYVLINPHYRFVGGMDRNTWLNPLLFFDNNDRQQCSGRFGEVGYINADKEGAKIGNAASGHSKSDGWDLTGLEAGVVRSDVDHSQAIFFTDVCSSAYVYTVTVKAINEMNNGKWGQVGVVDMVDEISFHSFFLYQDSMLKQTHSKYATLSLYGTGFGGWTWLDAGVTMPEYNEDGSVTFTVLKDGPNFYYIVGEKLLMSKYVEYLKGESCPGFYALDAIAEYTDYEAEDLSKNPEKIDEILASFNVYRMKKPDMVSGGKLEFSASAVSAGESVRLQLTPNNGFILTGLTVNGQDVYEEVAQNIQNGEYLLENVNETTEVVPTFSRIPQTVSVSGKIFETGTTSPVYGVKATVWGDDPLLYYSIPTAANGTYTFYLPKAGAQTIDGKEFNFNGEYVFKAKAGGYLSTNDTFVIANDTAIKKDYEMSKPVNNEYTWKMVGEEGEYTPSGTNYLTSSYAYTSDNKSDKVVYSVKISAPLGLTGYRSQVPNVGVTITDGTKLTEQKTNQNISYTVENELFAARIGLSNCGVVSHLYSLASTVRRLDRPVADRWNFSTLNEEAAFKNSTTERTLTIVILDDVVYTYVDGTYICKVSLLDTNYFFGDYKFNAGSQYTVGVNTTNIDHAATPISFKVLTEAYGEEANALIQGEAMFENIRELSKPVNSRNMVENNGVYTLTEKAMGLPWGYGGEAFYYTSEASNAVVYSVKATLTKPLIGYTNPSDGNTEGFVGYSNIGIFITDGNQYEGPKNGTPFGVVDRTSNYIHIGLSELGIVASSMGEMRRRLDTDSSIRWYLNQGGVNPDYAFTGDITERTLTIVLYQGVVYVFVDGVYGVKYALTDSNYFATTHFTFDANTQLKFGVGTEFVDSSVNSVSFTVLKQLTGNAALEEMKNNDLYSDAIFKIKANGVTKNADGSYTLGTGWLNYSYAYTTKKATDTAVYSVKFTNPTDMYGVSWHGHTGIVFSNGDTMGANTWTDANKSSSGRVCNEYFHSGALIGLNGQAAANSNKYISLTSGILSTWNERYYNLNTTAAFKDTTMTAVLYKGNIYIYVNGAYTTSVSLDNATFDYTNNLGVKKNISSSDKLIFGVAAVNANTKTTATVVKQLIDNEALEYIKANYSANVPVV